MKVGYNGALRQQPKYRISQDASINRLPTGDSMHTQKRKIITAIAVLGAISATFLISFRTGGQAPVEQPKKVQPDIEQKRKEFNKQFPTARYDEPEDQNLEKRAKRRLAGTRYEEAGGLVDDRLPIHEDEARTLITDEVLSVPAIPIKESELIIIGSVLEAAAHLSNNKKNVYSEFTVQIEDVIKDANGNIKKDRSITTDREGGYVEYINGLKRLHQIGGLLMPQVGRKYLFFLRNRERGPNYEIINGYELKDGGVVNLTGSSESKPFFGMDRTLLLSKVRKALADAMGAQSQKEY